MSWGDCMARRSNPRGTSNLSLAKTRSYSRQPKLESPMKRHGREDPVTAVSLEFGIPSPWNARGDVRFAWPIPGRLLGERLFVRPLRLRCAADVAVMYSADLGQANNAAVFGRTS